MDSILRTVRKLVGVHEDDPSFDEDLIIHINTAFQALTQMGVGPTDGFEIANDTALWSDFTGNTIALNPVKTVVCQRVKLAFDPPANAQITQSIQNTINEAEWRLSILVNKA